jgi:hemerythrin-like domain-containing protein
VPITIGAKQESNFDDPIGMLSDCHRRIERFLGTLIAVTEQAHGNELNGDQRASFTNALWYFQESAPKHTADEEESLFPRMRHAGAGEVLPVLAQIDALRRDHIRAEMNHQEVYRLGQEWLTRKELKPAALSQLTKLLNELRQMYERHIAIEDYEVFPCAAQLLSKGEQRELGLEMAKRRGVSALGGIAPVR